VKTCFTGVFFLLIVSAISAQQRDLTFYLEKAKQNSPLINKNQNEKKIAGLDLRQMKSVLSKPEINLISGVILAPIISNDNNSTRFELASDGANDYTGYDLALTEGGQYQALVSLKQPLFTGTKYKAYVNKADISGQINDNNINLTIHELEQVVAYQYILCIQSKKQADNYFTLNDELDEQLKIMKKLVENAIYKQTDLMILQIEAENYRAEYNMFLAEYLNNQYDLNMICGISDTTRVELQDINLTANPGSAGRSNFLTSYKLDSLDIIADQAIDELKYLPQLDLYADAGLNAAYLPSLNRLGVSAGIAFTWNIFDGHQRNIQREKSAINLQTLEFEKKNFLTRNDISKTRILNQIEAVNQRIMLYEQQTDQYNDLYKAYTKELSQGEASVMDLKNLIKDIASKKQEILQLKMEKQLLISSYNYLNY
jgi:outer membrane protein TolC